MKSLKTISTVDLCLEDVYLSEDGSYYYLEKTTINGHKVPETRFYPEDNRGVVNGFSSVKVRTQKAFGDIIVMNDHDWGRLESKTGSAKRTEKNRIMRKRLMKLARASKTV